MNITSNGKYIVEGFDRASALYERACKYGLHAGSMSQLEQFAVELQRLSVDAHEKRQAALARENEKLGLCDNQEAS